MNSANRLRRRITVLRSAHPLVYLLGIIFYVLSLAVYADGVDRFKQYIQNVQSLRANFHQVITDAKGQKIQDIEGQMQLLRPNQFRWDYKTPYIQEVVSDGESVWLYDPELKQVTVRSLKSAFGASPAVLLASNSSLLKQFELNAITRKGNLDWLLVTPHNKQADIQKVFLGFYQDDLRAMTLFDAFGNKTDITFSQIERNPKISPQNFFIHSARRCGYGTRMMNPNHIPLAERLRPQSLHDVVGQAHLLGEGKPLRVAFETGNLPSMILWGRPGVGKTTLARLIARTIQAEFIPLSAVLAGVKDIREAIERAELTAKSSKLRTILFVDEVHRFNKAQQDAFLPFVESGLITFIGATTENPSFEVNSALLSRAQVFVLNPLSADDLAVLLMRAQKDTACTISPEAREQILTYADGDARRLFNLLETLFQASEHDGVTLIDEVFLTRSLSQRLRQFDKGGEAFYDQISALHKAVRGSDPDASLYWLLRMLDGGADPLYLARRIVRIAIEDIGIADLRAQTIALEAYQIYERLGYPEGELALANAVIYLAVAPKSNATYKAYNAAKAFVAKDASREVPVHLRNAPTALMKNLNYGKHYRYAHDEPEAYAAGEVYFPSDLPHPPRFYTPTSRGLEIKIGEKLAHLRELDKQYHKKS